MKSHLEPWGYVGGTRRVYVRGDRNRRLHGEVHADPDPTMHNNYKWELLSEPLGTVLETGWRLHRTEAKADVTRAINRRLAILDN